jgi:peroxiredoxin (alkyl hydroperoxide reductase subunit C)
MFNNVQIGRIAPNFISVGVYKNCLGKIRLSDYQCKKYVILFFYPANFTSVALTELININERIAEFRSLSTQILGISIDSPFSHLEFLISKKSQGELYELNYPLISDLNHTISNKYNLLTKDGFSLPALFIIDKEGIIQYYNVQSLLCGRSVDELLRILKSIQYVKKNPGQGCPANWKDSDKIIDSYHLKLKLYAKNLYLKKMNKLCQN